MEIYIYCTFKVPTIAFWWNHVATRHALKQQFLTVNNLQRHHDLLKKSFCDFRATDNSIRSGKFMSQVGMH